MATFIPTFREIVCVGYRPFGEGTAQVFRFYLVADLVYHEAELNFAVEITDASGVCKSVLQ